MNILMLLNLLNLLLLSAAVILFLCKRVRNILPRHIIRILIVLLCLLIFRHFSNSFEWSGLTSKLDVYEDLIRILEPVFFGFLLFAFLQDRLKSQIAESESRYRLIIDNQTDLIVKMDSDGRFLFVSPSYCRKFGKNEAELLGKRYDGFIYEDDLPNTREYWQTLFSPPHTSYFRQRARTAAGIRWIAWSCKAVLNTNGGIRSVVATGRDITEQVQAQTEREKLLKALEFKNKELESVVYIASHDLQSPLVNIRGFAGELKRSVSELSDILPAGELPETRKRTEAVFEEIGESIHFITISAEKMQVLVDGLLTISRIGTWLLNIQTVDMNFLMNLLEKMMSYQIQQSKAQVEIEPLPPCRADANHVNQVFSNLLDNALKYRHPDRPGRILIYGEKKGPLCCYHIRDNGIGIEKHLQPKVFELFYRLNPDGPEKGAGLGLTIVSRIVERLGGSISVESVYGEGSIFTVCLPAAEE